ncbi:MAG: UDP-N-acetylmuramoyl-tripeptide--D-alanyl-D-alanine ligase [Microgenomates group bacterium Gr01-1014_5]|nr:MAG: UDP-N-acetylmuramoyl-tripeptide--D-alanyl-D-alanine ligase [Microgenomates group bacterium Gr01-1014_5]
MNLYLHILQLEGYQWKHFLTWVFGHLWIRKLGNKKPLVWTSKAIFLYYTAFVLTCLLPLLVFLISQNITYTGLTFVILFLQPYIPLLFSLALIKPFEIWNKTKTIQDTRRKVDSLPNLQVIGITGSFGKTSVKEFLYQILRTKYKVLKTPESYNTVFGISKVVELELDNSYDFFICEMGAYQRGEIAELAHMVRPKYGILTGIAQQHLERFGSIENIISGKFELIEALPQDGFAVLNIDSTPVKNSLKKVSVPFWGYGQDEKAEVRVEKVKLSIDGSRFVLVTPSGKLNLHTKLAGFSAIQNIAGAVAMALHLGVLPKKIVRTVASLEPVPARLEIIKQGELTILNDSFNSNPEGFREALETASLIKSKFKVLITPGIVDLGASNQEIHKGLGKLAAGVFDLVILVTDSGRTRGLESGLLAAKFEKEKIVFVKTLNDAMQLLREKAKLGTLVLLENDLPDNY